MLRSFHVNKYGGNVLRQSQEEEEAVQGKDQEQVEQLGSLRQAYLRQAPQRSPNLLVDHTLHRQ